MVGSCFPRSGIYIFLVSLACLHYIINAPLLLAHYDLGWHLAAGDLITDQGRVPFHDPWSFTSAGRQWFNLSWLWDVIASLLFQHASFTGLIVFVIACGAVIAGYLTSLCLSSGASAIAVCISVLSACLLYPAFSAAYPNIYLAASPNISTMLFSVIFYGECLKRTRWIFLLPVVMALWANLHGGLAWPSYCWHFLRRGIAQTRLGEFQNLWFRGGRLLYRDTCQSPWLAYLPRLGERVGPLLSGLHHRVVALLSEYSRAGEHSWHHIHFSVRCV